MLNLAHHSLKRSLLLLLIFATGFAFLSNFTAFLVYERYTLRKGLVRDLRTQALVLSQAVSADLDFGTMFDSNRTLKFLATNRHILGAEIFDKDGQRFASLAIRPNGMPLPEVGSRSESAVFHDGVLDLFVRIDQDGETKGTLFIRSDLDEIHNLFLATVKIMSATGLGLLVMVLIAATLLQRKVSAPILSLADMAKRISRERDFSLRLGTRHAGEIGELKDAFNEILDQIQDRDSRLMEYQEHLEELVQKRSEQLLQIQQLNSATLEALPAFIGILDAESNLLATNQKWIGPSGAANPFIGKARIGDNYLDACITVSQGPGNPPDLAPGIRNVLSGVMDSGQIDYEIDAPDGHQWYSLLLTRFMTAGSFHVVLMHQDITRQKVMEVQLSQAQKLESIGQLAAGIAHEINTPVQYVGDNLNFLKESFGDVCTLLTELEALASSQGEGEGQHDLAGALRHCLQGADLQFLGEEIPKALTQSLEGLNTVAKIVRATKEFSHPGTKEKTLTDLNRAIESTSMVCRNEWKYDADLELDLDPDLPLVPCLPDEFNQVILNLLINSTHAIQDVQRAGSPETKGKIRVATRLAGDRVEIRVEDSGAGIPESIQSRIFDPFFTTKEVGKGTGQGLAIAYSVIVKKHGGTISVNSQVGKGTTFNISLPTIETSQ